MMVNSRYPRIVFALFEFCLCGKVLANLADTRHYVPPPVKQVAIQFPVYKNTELMVSPCRPEIDGYFGATAGEPVILEYAFSMDSYENANIDDALEHVREYVMDLIAGAVFPKTCKSRDLQVREVQLVGKVTGFRFDLEMHTDKIHMCKPMDGNGSTCAIYRGRVALFGKFDNTDASRILNVILTSLPSSFSSLLRYGIAHIHGASAYSSLTIPTTNGRRMSLGAIFGICLATLLLLFGIGILVRFMTMQQSIESTHKVRHQRNRRGGWASFIFGHKHYDENDCASTVASSVCSRYTAVESTPETSTGVKNYRPSLVAGLRLPVRQPRQNHIPQLISHKDDDSPYIVEPEFQDDDDLPYVVDPDDDDVDYHKSALLHGKCGEDSGKDSLSSTRFDVF